MSFESGSLRIEEFRGDYAAVAGLMQRSWAENRETPLLYTAEFLASAFTYPGASRSLTLAVYDDDRPMAFTAGLPRAAVLDGNPIRLVLHSFVTAAPELKGKGFARAVWGRATGRARECGYDGTVNFCVEGDILNTVILKWSAANGLVTKRVFSIPYLAAMVRPRLADEDDGREADVDVFLETAEPIPAAAPLARLWTPEEAEWQCRRRLGALSVQHERAGRGVLSGYTMETADDARTRCAMVDDVLWGTLEAGERPALVRKLLARAASAGVKLVVVPCLGYASMDPFLAAGFRRTRRVLHTFLTLWNRTPPDALPSLYLDVF